LHYRNKFLLYMISNNQLRIIQLQVKVNRCMYLIIQCMLHNLINTNHFKLQNNLRHM